MKNKENQLYKMLLWITIIFSLLFMIIVLEKDFASLYNTLVDIGKKQISNKSLLVGDYAYTGNLYIINPGLLLTFFGNNLVVRFIVTILLVFIYFLLIYKISNRYLNKCQKIILLLILLCGISKDYMLSIFLYNQFIYHAIISLGIFYFCIRVFHEIKLPKIIIFTILIVLLGINSFYNLYIIIIPYIILVLFFRDNKSVNHNKIILLLSIIVLLYLFFAIVFNKYSTFMFIYNPLSIKNRFISILDVLINVFGFSGGKDLISISSNIVFYDSFSDYSLVSIYGITNLLRFLFMIFTIIIVPIILIKNRKKNEKSINRLAIFNLFSLVFNILFYVILGTFEYDITDIKYFLFNYIIMFIVDIYVVNKYLLKYDFAKKLIFTFFILFIVFNIISNLIYI